MGTGIAVSEGKNNSRSGEKIKSGIYNTLLALFTVLTLSLLGFILILRFTDSTVLSVQSGSMSPVFNEGDAIVIRRTATDKHKSGDIVTVQTPDKSRSFTHRIIRVDFEEGLVYTGGDALKSEDPMPADISLVIGKYWFKIPFLGSFSQKMNIRFILILLAIIWLVLTAARFVLTAIKKRKAGEKDAKN